MSQVCRIVLGHKCACPLPHPIHNAEVGRYSWVRSCLLITLIKCLKGLNSLGSLFSVVEDLIVSGNGQKDQGTDRHAVLLSCLWTAKKQDTVKCANSAYIRGAFLN